MRVFRTTLFWFARVAGVIGLVAGGKALGKYVYVRLHDPYFDPFSYTDLVFNGGVIFLLSLLVLIVAEVGQSLERACRMVIAGRSDSEAARSAVKPGGTAPSQAAHAGVLEAGGGRTDESADERLARLLKQKSE